MSQPTMNNITQRCVSLANGDLSPDLRVNYEFGLVLGVDEFRQEQLYFLEKEYLHNCALHGFGTVSGLPVTLQAQANDLQITVGPGIGIDQFGRTFIIRNDQCALLGAWLKKQQPPVSAGDGGLFTLYLVGTYDECPDALVRIAGQPCSSSDQTTAPSRIRDSFNLTLRTTPPAMQEWDAVRRFALLLSRLEFDAGLPPDQSDEGYITKVVQLLGQPGAGGNLDLRLPADPPPPGAPAHYRLPSQDANLALDRIFTVWATQVRPQRKAALIDPRADPDAESAVLLATITFTMAGDAINGPAVSAQGRPFLLHTQLIQELMLHGESADGKPVREFATLHVTDAKTILVWCHHPEDLSLSEDSFRLRVNDNEVAGHITPLPNLHNIFQIVTADGADPIAANARVELRFDLTAVGIVQEPGAPPKSLFDEVDTLIYGYLGREGQFVNVYTFYTLAQENLTPVREFVSFKTVVQEQQKPTIQLWIHAPTPLDLSTDNLTVLADEGSTPLTISVNAVGGPLPSLWMVNIEAGDPFQDGMLLTFEFNTDKLNAGGSSLTAVMQNGQFEYLGYEAATATITAYYIVEIPVTQAQTPGLTAGDVEKMIGRVQTLPFITITPLEANAPGLDTYDCELWFHIDLDPEEYVVEIAQDSLNLPIFAEIGGKLVPMKAGEIKKVQRNLFQAIHIVQAQGFTQGQYTYLRFLFPLDEIQIKSPDGGFSLRDFILKQHIKFDGYYGDDSKFLVAFVRARERLVG